MSWCSGWLLAKAAAIVLSLGGAFVLSGKRGLLLGKGQPDVTDCYFDKECHAKVDWSRIGKVKAVFFADLKKLKDADKVDLDKVRYNMASLVDKMRYDFAKAGVPSDRIDYILTKWIEYVFPEGLEINYIKSTIAVSGFTCANGYENGKHINQPYAYAGATADGRPYYRGTKETDRYLYYDKYCADDTRTPRWLLGRKPDPRREFDLNVMDSPGCNNEFSIETDSMHLPGGRQKLAWNWCGDHGLHDTEMVSITYDLSGGLVNMNTKSKPAVDQAHVDKRMKNKLLMMMKLKNHKGMDKKDWPKSPSVVV